MIQNPPPVAGLRERKKQKTRELIQREAIRLFKKRGYGETTIEQIAEAAEISPSTFFNYFPSKEDVVLMDVYDPIVEQMVMERPKDEPLIDSLVAILAGGLAAIMERDKDLILDRSKLIIEVPELRGRLWDELLRSQDWIRTLMAERSGRDPEDFELKVTAALLIGALFAAVMEWAKSEGRQDFSELVTRAATVVKERGALL
jgi:AcrR family transcriptional regulator